MRAARSASAARPRSSWTSTTPCASATTRFSSASGASAGAASRRPRDVSGLLMTHSMEAAPRSPDHPVATRSWWLFAIAAATFLPVLRFHYVGEEAIYTISSLEMWYRGEWVQQLLYGATL